MKLLITSVGSLLGQNILDSIESRRDQIKVFGTNSIAKNPRNFRCDQVFLVNNTAVNGFKTEFELIMAEVKPDLILPGRDEDCIFLADYKSRHPNKIENIIPFGTSAVPKIMMDKYNCFSFCNRNGLPFADSYLYQGEKDRNGLNRFLEKHNYPLVVKPREGFGSIGVFFICNQEQLEETISTGREVLFQEYLGQPEYIFQYQNIFSRGIPLFFQVPEEDQFALQFVIHPDGSVQEFFISKNTMVFGKPETSKQIYVPEIEELGQEYAKTLFEHGWYGPVNIQLKPDQAGKWKAFELNPRLSGSSSARTLLGYDEIGILANIFAPHLGFPNLTKTQKVKGQVIKYLTDNVLLEEDINTLQNKKVWKKS